MKIRYQHFSMISSIPETKLIRWTSNFRNFTIHVRSLSPISGSHVNARNNYGTSSLDSSLSLIKAVSVRIGVTPHVDRVSRGVWGEWGGRKQASWPFLSPHYTCRDGAITNSPVFGLFNYRLSIDPNAEGSIFSLFSSNSLGSRLQTRQTSKTWKKVKILITDSSFFWDRERQ